MAFTLAFITYISIIRAISPLLQKYMIKYYSPGHCQQANMLSATIASVRVLRQTEKKRWRALSCTVDDATRCAPYAFK